MVNSMPMKPHPLSDVDADPGLTPHELRRFAAAAAVHPTTLQRYISGLRIRSTCQAHIERALADLGRRDLLRGALS